MERAVFVDRELPAENSGNAELDRNLMYFPDTGHTVRVPNEAIFEIVNNEDVNRIPAQVSHAANIYTR